MMCGMCLTTRGARKKLKENGFEHKSTKGTHEKWVGYVDGKLTTTFLSEHSGDVPKGTLAAIRKQTGIDDMK